jgi:hypothetical protein
MMNSKLISFSSESLIPKPGEIAVRIEGLKVEGK